MPAILVIVPHRVLFPVVVGENGAANTELVAQIERDRGMWRMRVRGGSTTEIAAKYKLTRLEVDEILQKELNEAVLSTKHEAEQWRQMEIFRVNSLTMKLWDRVEYNSTHLADGRPVPPEAPPGGNMLVESLPLIAELRKLIELRSKLYGLGDDAGSLPPGGLTVNQQFILYLPENGR